MNDSQLQTAPALPTGSTEAPRIVIIAAHHDDIEFGNAGSVAGWVRDGAEVSYVIITDGSAGSNEPDVVPSELAERRRVEQIQAAEAVGVRDVRFLGYQDGTLQPTIELRKTLTRILREIRPFRVVCQDPSTIFFGDSYINHPDHRAAGEAAVYATFPSSETRPIFPELLAEGYEPHKVSELFLTLTNHPTHYVDITDVIDQKITSLAAHESQIGPASSEPEALKWIRQMDAESGQRAGVGYAELYKVMLLDRPPVDEEGAVGAAAEARS